MSGPTCEICQTHWDPSKGEHFCPRCAECDGIVEADVAHICEFFCGKCDNGFQTKDGRNQHLLSCEGHPLEPITRGHLNYMRRPAKLGGMVGTKIKVGNVHFEVRKVTTKDVVLRPLGWEK